MRRPFTLALTASLAIAGVAAMPADAGGDKFWFTCEGATPVTQADVLLGGSVGSWNDVEPTGSTDSGSGCMSIDGPAEGTSNDNSVYDSAWTGSYKGAVQDIGLTFYVASVNHYSNFSVTISSGEEILFDGTAGHDFLITDDGPYPETFVMEATITGLDLKDKLHDLTVKISTTQDPILVFYGAGDAPAAITFNPAEILGNEIAA